MKKTVLFLGAGMSATFGYPVTQDILPTIIQKLKKGSLYNDVTKDKEVAAIYRRLLKQLIICLMPGISFIFKDDVNVKDHKAKLPLVTELLSQLEHLIGSNHALFDWSFDLDDLTLKPSKLNDRWDLTNLKTLFDWAIINVINDKQPFNSKAISEFLEWITEKNRGKKHFISIVSTNYDVALEWELLDYGQAWDADTEIDFGVSWRDPVIEKSIIYNRPADPVYRIFKLHGSTDWLKCPRCGYLYINPTVDIYTLTFSNQKRDANKCHCGYWPLQPLLVTPSFVRKMEEPNLQEIWKSTFEELRTADEWIIVGYSLPAEDFDIRSLFLRAINSHTRRPSIKVIQRTRASEPRYDMFFGKGNYSFIDGGFEKYIPTLLKGATASNTSSVKGVKLSGQKDQGPLH
jgi:hypothetical protein